MQFWPYLEKAEHNIWDSAWRNFVAQKKTLIAFDVFANFVMCRNIGASASEFLDYRSRSLACAIKRPRA